MSKKLDKVLFPNVSLVSKNRIIINRDSKLFKVYQNFLSFAEYLVNFHIQSQQKVSTVAAKVAYIQSKFNFLCNGFILLGQF